MPVSRTLEVLLRLGGTREYRQGLAEAEQATRGFGDAVEQEGRSIGQSFQDVGNALLPISAAVAAIGGAAVGLALPYDRAFTQIQTLVGVAADEVDAMRVGVLELAGDTARAPEELASAMFTIQSAGLQGAAGTEALAVAAQQAALGMGDTRANAQNLTSALNAYRGVNLTAAEAGDILTATVRAGNFEASQLAGSLGRVLPNAVASGVAFEDVGGAIALFTRTSGDANLALTQLDGLMRTFIRPSQQAQEILASFGLTMNDVRDVIQQDGLVAAVQLLDETFGGNRETLARVIEDSTGLTAAFQILDADAATLEATFGAVSNSTGLLGDAFGQLGDSDAFRFDQAVNAIRVSLTQLGVEVLPIAAAAFQRIADGIGLAVDTFTSLPAPLQTAIIQLSGFVALLGPGLIAVGRFVEGVGRIPGAVSSLATALQTANPLMLGLTAAAVAGVVVWANWAENQREAAERAEALREVLATGLNSEIETLITDLQRLNDVAEGTPESIDQLADVVGDLRAEANLLVNELEADGLVSIFNQLGLSLSDQVIPAVRTGTDIFEDLQDALARGESDVNRVRERFDELDPSVRATAEAILAAVDANVISAGTARDLLDVLDEQADAYDDTRESVEETARAELERAIALGTLTQEQVAAALAFLTATGQVSDYTNALRILGPEVQENLFLAEVAAGNYEVLTERYGNIIEPILSNVQAQEELRRSSEELVNAAGGEIERLETLITSNRNLADSYDAVSAATAPYRAFLEASIDPAIRFQQAQDASTLAVQALTDQLNEQDNELRGALSGGFDTVGAAAANARGAFITLGESLRNNLIDLAEADASTAELAAEQERLIDDLTAVGVAMGLTSAEAREYALELIGIPPEVRTLLAADVETAREGVNNLIALALEYGELDPEAVLALEDAEAQRVLAGVLLDMQGFDAETFAAQLDADATNAERETAAALLLLAGYDDTEVQAILDGDDAALQDAVRGALLALGQLDGQSADLFFNVITTVAGSRVSGLRPGSGVLEAGGGVLDFYSAGGVRENHVAQIAPAGAWRVWAEPETQGEAYIPLANDWRRGRAQQIWTETGRRIGMLGGDGPSIADYSAGGLDIPGVPYGRGMAFPIGGVISAAFSGDRIDINATVDISIAELAGGGGSLGGTVVNVNAGAVRVTVEGGAAGDLPRLIRNEVEGAFCEILGEARSGGAVRPRTHREGGGVLE